MCVSVCVCLYITNNQVLPSRMGGATVFSGIASRNSVFCHTQVGCKIRDYPPVSSNVATGNPRTEWGFQSENQPINVVYFPASHV